MTKVLIVDDKKMDRDCIKAYLQSAQDRYCVVGEITNASVAEEFCQQKSVDLIIMDVRTEGDTDGIQATAAMKSKRPHIKIVVVTGMTVADLIDRAKHAKADSFWFKESIDQELIEVLDRTVRGESVYPDCVPLIHIGNMPSTEITPAEMRVLRLVAKGCSNGEISEALGISVTTVRYHVKQLLSKSGYSNRVSLVAEVISKKYFAPGW